MNDTQLIYPVSFMPLPNNDLSSRAGVWYYECSIARSLPLTNAIVYDKLKQDQQWELHLMTSPFGRLASEDLLKKFRTLLPLPLFSLSSGLSDEKVDIDAVSTLMFSLLAARSCACACRVLYMIPSSMEAVSLRPMKFAARCELMSRF